MSGLVFGNPNPMETINNIFSGSPEPLKAAQEWARQQLDARGIRPDQQMKAAKALREAEHALDLNSAMYLAESLA